MKIAYEKMKKTLFSYLDSLSKLHADRPETIEYSRQFLADDYQVRFGDMPDYAGVDMMEGMAHEHAEKWVTYVVYDREPFYWMFDEEQGMAAGYFAEELRDLKTGELLRSSLVFSHIFFVEEDGQVKLYREHMVDVPAKIRVDAI